MKNLRYKIEILTWKEDIDSYGVVVKRKVITIPGYYTNFDQATAKRDKINEGFKALGLDNRYRATVW